jgi:hypothetical protein
MNGTHRNADQISETRVVPLRMSHCQRFSRAPIASPDAVAPEILEIIWPADGSRLSGNSFTLRGQLDDDNATVVAQITGGGQTTTLSGLVERGGLFWVENLPLADGDNTLTIAATNAAGLGDTLTITVVKSTVELVIDYYPVDVDLYEEVGTVGGTISPTSAIRLLN